MTLGPDIERLDRLCTGQIDIEASISIDVVLFVILVNPDGVDEELEVQVDCRILPLVNCELNLVVS